MMGPDHDLLTIALAKGRMLEPSFDLLEEAGYDCSFMHGDSRKLVFENSDQRVRFIMAKPVDLPTYIEYGVADLGIVGRDILMEQERELYELLDLKIGYCRLVVARHRDSNVVNPTFVATHYPSITERYYQQKGKQVEIIKLNGSVELAPLLGLADFIVDLVSTGATLKENNLVEIEQIIPITSRLVANQRSYQLKGKRIAELLNNMEKAVDKLEEGD